MNYLLKKVLKYYLEKKKYNTIKSEFNDFYEDWINLENAIESFKKSYINLNQLNNY